MAKKENPFRGYDITTQAVHMGTDYESLRWIRGAAEKGADLICFPEIQLSPFFTQYTDRNAVGL